VHSRTRTTCGPLAQRVNQAIPNAAGVRWLSTTTSPDSRPQAADAVVGSDESTPDGWRIATLAPGEPPDFYTSENPSAGHAGVDSGW
jgi:hypothetical protein